MDKSKETDLIDGAIALAEAWQNRANQLLTHEEKGIQEQMQRLLTSPMDKVVLTKLIDLSFRSHDNDRVADQVNSILRQYGVPDFFSRVEKLLIQMFLGVGHHFPWLSVPKMIDKMRQNSSRAIIAGERDPLHAHLRKRKQQGVRMNINHLGEAVLGEKECRHRFDTYLSDLTDPNIEYISVKISTIYSQISSLAFNHTVGVLRNRLSELYRTAAAHVFERADGTRTPKFVNLDMEEYRDMEITFQAFVETLNQEEFKAYSAGIVLQAYLPDAHLFQKELTRWAKDRVAGGGAPVKLRIVKGANMETEQLESSLRNWPLAPFDNKLAVDANYKRMLDYGMQPKHIRSVHLGVASHNLFDLAYAHQLAGHYGVNDYFYFEMLEGMADHVRRALCEMPGDVLLYAPVATKSNFLSAIAYLIRRLDENTSPENFLRYAPKLEVSSPEWDFLKEQFIESCHMRHSVGLGPNRIQDRGNDRFEAETGTYFENEFNNEPDTDWALPPNRRWAEEIRRRWSQTPDHKPFEIPLVVGGEDIFDGRPVRESQDPSQYDPAVTVARFAEATPDDVDRAVAVAKEDPDGWRTATHRQRHDMLSKVAVELRRARGDLIGAAAADTGKVFTEADVEVSEAIDFAEFYPFSVMRFAGLETVTCRGKGVGVVVSPWNFPVAIPCGGIVGTLASGNTAILKPSSDAVLTAWELCKCFWKAGISKNVLQFLPCRGSTEGPKLTNHPDVHFVILTGGTDTGMKILDQRPEIYLAAETGGKNATIVTAMADRDQAIGNVIYSAFGNCGQKCSATSLLILEKEVYEDPQFREQLVDAAESALVGSAWDFQNKIGPLIHEPTGDLKRALTTLAPGESWALKPKNLMGNPLLWTPGIKWDVQPGSDTHMTEFFGPLLGVMRAENLAEAVSLVNQTGYGLTSGLESLDKREQAYWQTHIRAGNLYVNRGTTGAVTLRQPFGGMGKSALGPGIKAGGPDYVAQFMDFEENGYPKTGVIEKDYDLHRLALNWRRQIDGGKMAEHRTDILKSVRAIKSYLFHMERKFSCRQDYFHLRGQDNILRYLPIGKISIRLHEKDNLFDVLARIAASRISGCNTVVSIPRDLHNRVTDFLFTKNGQAILCDSEVIRQTDAQLADAIPSLQRIRYAGPDRVPKFVYMTAAKIGLYIARSPVVMEGGIELLQYYRQQSICDNYHRYGNLGDRTTA
jgi:RHH-type transcriptional regulator, proline utilization regulon repressor / proline dehydrogenase / delta 1-pyrroline-5-carboxylate dehydrogenase